MMARSSRTSADRQTRFVAVDAARRSSLKGAALTYARPYALFNLVGHELSATTRTVTKLGGNVALVARGVADQ